MRKNSGIPPKSKIRKIMKYFHFFSKDIVRSIQIDLLFKDTKNDSFLFEVGIKKEIQFNLKNNINK